MGTGRYWPGDKTTGSSNIELKNKWGYTSALPIPSWRAQ